MTPRLSPRMRGPQRQCGVEGFAVGLPVKRPARFVRSRPAKGHVLGGDLRLGALRDAHQERVLFELAFGTPVAMHQSQLVELAAEIRLKQTAGEKIANFTVGDFSSKEFPIPDRLRDGVLRALAAGETNYPPSDGVLRLREAVREFWGDRLQLDVPVESILIAGGSRPVIYAAYRTLIEPGDVVVYPVPSWNNNHYCHLVGARGVALAPRADDGFLPTAASLQPHLRTARMIALCTPLNPAGTVLAPAEVHRIAEAVVPA